MSYISNWLKREDSNKTSTDQSGNLNTQLNGDDICLPFSLHFLNLRYLTGETLRYLGTHLVSADCAYHPKIATNPTEKKFLLSSTIYLYPQPTKSHPQVCLLFKNTCLIKPFLQFGVI